MWMSHYVVRTLVNYLITVIAWHLIFAIVFVVTVFIGHLLYKLNADNISRIAPDLTMWASHFSHCWKEENIIISSHHSTDWMTTTNPNTKIYRRKRSRRKCSFGWVTKCILFGILTLSKMGTNKLTDSFEMWSGICMLDIWYIYMLDVWYM